MNTARKKNRLLSFLLALVMIFGMLPLASLLPTRVAAASYPSSLNKLVEGKKIYEGTLISHDENVTVVNTDDKDTSIENTRIAFVRPLVKFE